MRHDTNTEDVGRWELPDWKLDNSCQSRMRLLTLLQITGLSVTRSALLKTPVSLEHNKYKAPGTTAWAMGTWPVGTWASVKWSPTEHFARTHCMPRAQLQLASWTCCLLPPCASCCRWFFSPAVSPQVHLVVSSARYSRPAPLKSVQVLDYMEK